MTNAEACKAAVGIIRAVVDTVQEVGRAPAGAVYTALMAYGCTYNQFDGIVNVMVEAKLVRREGHELVWIGPKKGE